MNSVKAVIMTVIPGGRYGTVKLEVPIGGMDRADIKPETHGRSAVMRRSTSGYLEIGTKVQVSLEPGKVPLEVTSIEVTKF